MSSTKTQILWYHYISVKDIFLECTKSGLTRRLNLMVVALYVGKYSITERVMVFNSTFNNNQLYRGSQFYWIGGSNWSTWRKPHSIAESESKHQ